MIIKTFILLIFAATVAFAQGFKVKASGEQTFNFEDKYGRNHVRFFSTTPLEDITGISNEVKGTVTFDVADIRNMKGSLNIPVASIKTAIDLRDEHLRSENWLNAAKFPEITFVIKKVDNARIVEDNKIEAKVTGDFTVHGVTKEVVAEATITYLDASEQTAQFAPGDLLGVQAKFYVALSDFNVENMIVGQKVAETVEVTANLRGTNAK
jgi:polyisoprenoid-binding protein YceI